MFVIYKRFCGVPYIGHGTIVFMSNSEEGAIRYLKNLKVNNVRYLPEGPVFNRMIPHWNDGHLVTADWCSYLLRKEQ